MNTELFEKIRTLDTVRFMMRCILTNFDLQLELREFFSKIDDSLTSSQQLHALQLSNLNGKIPVDAATFKRMVDDWISLTIEAYQSGVTCFQAQAHESSVPFIEAACSFVIWRLNNEICVFTNLREAIRTNGTGEPANTT